MRYKQNDLVNTPHGPGIIESTDYTNHVHRYKVMITDGFFKGSAIDYTGFQISGV